MRHWSAVGIVELQRTAESTFVATTTGRASPQFNGSLIVFLNGAVRIAAVHRYGNQIEQSFVALLALPKSCFRSFEVAQIDDGGLVQQREVFRRGSDRVAQKDRWNL